MAHFSRHGRFSQKLRSVSSGRVHDVETTPAGRVGIRVRDGDAAFEWWLHLEHAEVASRYITIDTSWEDAVLLMEALMIYGYTVKPGEKTRGGHRVR